MDGQSGRIEDLRRRVQEDPASIAFAQLAEEYRRAGRFSEAADVCRDGLVLHPDYLSARITLGRALLGLDRLDEAEDELRRVVQTAPANLAAIRGLAEVHERRGAWLEALAYYRTALLVVPEDPELERLISEVSARLADTKDAETRAQALKRIGALEQWLNALHVSRIERLA